MAKTILSDKHREMGLAERDRDPNLPIKIFIASPDDVKKLRAITLSIIEQEHNESFRSKTGKNKFQPYAWETSLDADFVEDGVQERIFEQFGDWCDIFILLFWGKLGGGGTKKEYNKFINHYRAINPNIKLWSLVYNEKIHYSDVNIDQLSNLRTFLDENQGSWLQIGITRGSIQSETEYAAALRSLLNDYSIP